MALYKIYCVDRLNKLYTTRDICASGILDKTKQCIYECQRPVVRRPPYMYIYIVHGLDELRVKFNNNVWIQPRTVSKKTLQEKIFSPQFCYKYNTYHIIGVGPQDSCLLATGPNVQQMTTHKHSRIDTCLSLDSELIDPFVDLILHM